MRESVRRVLYVVKQDAPVLLWGIVAMFLGISSAAAIYVAAEPFVIIVLGMVSIYLLVFAVALFYITIDLLITESMVREPTISE